MPAGRGAAWAVCALLLAPAAVAQGPARMHIAILPPPAHLVGDKGQARVDELASKLRESIADRGDGSARLADDFSVLSGIRSDSYTQYRDRNMDHAAVKIYSDTDIKSMASRDFRVTAGGSFQGKVAKPASLTGGGSFELQSLGVVKLFSGDDAEFSVEGDVGALANGAVQIVSASLQAQIGGAGEVTAGGDLRLESGGAASVTIGESLQANVAGDIEAVGAGLNIGATDGLSVLAGNIDLQTPGSVRVQGSVGTVQMDQTVDIRTKGNLEATAAADMLLSADGVSLNAASTLDVSAVGSAGLVTRDVSVRALGVMDARAANLGLKVSEGIDAFSGGDLTGSLGSISAGLRGDADLSASGDVALSSSAGALSLTGPATASADSLRVDTLLFDLKTSNMDAAASERASLHTTDASISADGTLTAFVASSDIHAEANLGLQAAGAVSLKTAGAIELASMDSTSLRTGSLSTVTNAVRINADNVDVYSDSALHTTASGDLLATAGGKLKARVTGEASVIAGGDLELKTPGSAKLFSANDAELAVEGDVGMTASGSAQIAAGSLESRVAGFVFLDAGGDLRARTGGAASFEAAESLQASVGGELGVSGAGIDVGTEWLSVVSGGIDVQTPGSMRVQGSGAAAKLDGGVEISAASTLQAAAAAGMLLAADQVSLNAATALEVSSDSARLSSDGVSILALMEMRASAASAELQVAEGITAFSGAELRGSFGSASLQSFDGLELTASGDVSLSSVSGAVAMTGEVSAAAETVRLDLNSLDVVAPRLDAAAAEHASLHTTDASLSAGGTVTAFVASTDITAEADLGMEIGGEVSLKTAGAVELSSVDSTTLHTGKLSAITQTARVNADNVDVYSGTSIRSTASRDLHLTAGGKFSARTTEEASITAGGDLELQTPGSAKLFTGGDAELAVQGDIGAAAAGALDLSAASLRSEVAGAGSLTTGGDVRAEAFGGASMEAGSLHANVRGDIGVAGAALNVAGAKGVSVLAADVDVQTPGSVHLQASGAGASLDDGFVNVTTASYLEAVATAEMMLAADEVAVNAASSLDVSAGDSAGLLSKDVKVLALDGLEATAGSANLQVSEGIDTFSGGDVSASLGGLSAGLRGGADLTAAGDISLSSVTGTASLTGKVTAAAESLRLNIDELDVAVPRVDAASSQRATLHTTDASISADGTLSAFVASSDITAEGSLGVQADGSLAVKTREGIELSATDSATLRTGSLSASTNSVRVIARGDQTGEIETISVDMECGEGGCDEQAALEQMAAMLGIRPERLRASPL